MQSSSGLSTPVDNQANYDANHLKPGDRLSKLQRRLNYGGRNDRHGKHLIGIVMDEYSMISSLQMYWASDRVQQATFNSDQYFGGVPTVIFGDAGQLPPVGGTQLWVSKTSTGKPLGPLAMNGHTLYKSIETVMSLTEVKRQRGFFKEFLLRLRNGANTEEDWRRLNSQCSIEAMTREQVEAFQDADTIFLYSTNEACRIKNTERLIALNQPIVLLTAEHDDDAKSCRKSADAAKSLQRHLLCSVGSKVMLLWNIALPIGLVNGSSGVVIDFVYITTHAPELPAFIIIEFPDYTGPPFFQGLERSKWVPLPPSTAEWYGGDGTMHFRRQFPISLAWALTTWKAQGMTCSGKVYAEFPPTENLGISYVNKSRLTKMENLCIGRAIPLDRLTTKISKCKGLVQRLEEDARLRTLWEKTKIYYDDSNL